jgi:hypothetical protein
MNKPRLGHVKLGFKEFLTLSLIFNGPLKFVNNPHLADINPLFYRPAG